METIIVNEDDLCLGMVDIKQLIDLFNKLSADGSRVIRISQETMGLEKFGLDPIDRLFIAGDDCTINFVVNFLFEHDGLKYDALGKPKIGIIPCGLSNSIAEEIYDITEPFYVLRQLLKEDSRILQLDLPKLHYNSKENYFVHMVDIGLNPKTKIKENMIDRNGRSYFYSSLMSSWMRKRTFNYKLIDDRDAERAMSAAMIGIANTKKYGRNGLVNRDASYNDGKVELLEYGLQDLNTNPSFPWELAQSTSEPGWIETYSLPRFKLIFAEEQYMQVDGCSLGPQSKIEVHVTDHSLQILKPASIYTL